MGNEWNHLVQAKNYDEFMIKKLGIPDKRKGYFIPDIIPSREELVDFAVSKGMGVEHNLSKTEIVEKLLYEYGITNQEIKDTFRKYLGIEEAYFIEKYHVSKAVLEKLKERNLVPVVYLIYEKAAFLDAEYYFSKERFERAIRIFSDCYEQVEA